MKLTERIFGDRVDFDYRSVILIAMVILIVGGASLAVGVIIGSVYNLIA